MGKAVESLAASHDCRVAGIVSGKSAADALASQDFGDVDVAIDFTLAGAVRGNLEAMASRGWNVVIGTTGWQADEAACRSMADRAGIGVLASANFSIGMQIFRGVVEEA